MSAAAAYDAFFAMAAEVAANPPVFSPDPRKASISAVFRILPQYEPISLQGLDRQDTSVIKREFDRAFEGREKHVQVLFIRRSISQRDIHSGQVALPGGKTEAGETPYQCAVRETLYSIFREEIGLDLRPPDKFLYIGSTAEIDPYKITGRARVLHLSTHSIPHTVFLQLDSSTPALTLNEAEVAAYRWVDFEVFTHKFHEWFRPKVTSAGGISGRRPIVTMRLAAITLPLRPSIDPPVPSGHKPDDSTEFTLWGITYRVSFMQRIRAIVKLVPALLKTNSDADWVYYQVQFPFCLFSIMFSWVDRMYGPDDIDLRAYQRYTMAGMLAGTGVAAAAGLRWLGYL